jgi:hypothetical protein
MSMQRLIQFLVLLNIFVAMPALAQNDVAVTGIEQPRSGCARSSNENVGVHIFNYGRTLPAGTVFTVSYSINAGTPVTELITLALSLLSKSAIDYSFTTQANLAAPRSYTLNAFVTLAGDINPSNDSFANYIVTSSAPSVGGFLVPTMGPSLSGSVTLVGQTGNVLEWQQSVDGGLRWRKLTNITTVQTFDQLREDTTFRALVQNGFCPPTVSTAQGVLSSDSIFYSGFEP